MTPLRKYLFGLLLLLAVGGLRLPFATSRVWNVDEGITITAAETILDGGVLYRDLADQRAPLVPYLKAGLFAVFGHWNLTVVQVALVLMLGVAAIGLWRIGAGLGAGRAGAVAAVVSVLLGFVLPIPVDAMAVHTEWFLVFFSVCAFWVLVAALDVPGVFRGAAVGLLFGLSCLSKQPGVLDLGVAFVLVGLLVAAARGERGPLLRLGAGMLGGFLLTIGGALAVSSRAGALSDLLYYTWFYNNRIYVPAVPLGARLETMAVPFRLAAEHAPAALVLGGLGAVGLAFGVFDRFSPRTFRPRLGWWLALGWSASGLVATGLSGRGFSHYSIQLIPGLSLICGLSAVWLWDRRLASPRWRVAVPTACVLLVGDTVGRTVRRIRILGPEDSEWTDSIRLVTRATAPEDRVFFWGFCPDGYVHARRLPASRYVYTTFLTGLVPWTNVDPLVDTRSLITPGSWDRLREDFERHPPEMIIGTGSIRYQNKYPLHDEPWLWSYVTRGYAEVAFRHDALRDLRFFQRLDSAAPESVLPAGLPVSPLVQLETRYTDHAEPTPLVVVHAPAGTSKLELFANGVLFRTIALRDVPADVAFFVPADSLPADVVTFQALATCGDQRLASNECRLTAAEVVQHVSRVPGPPIRLPDGELRPRGSEGRPVLRSSAPEVWLAPATSKLVYRRPAGLRSFTLNFGIDEGCYYDRPDRRASDGVDFVVDYTPEGGATERLFRRRMHPKVDAGDCGLQQWEHVFGSSEPGTLVVRVLAGPENNDENDWAYLQEMTGTVFGPVARFGTSIVLSERVSAHGAPAMTMDPSGRWIAHSPSSVSYRPPESAGAFLVEFGLDPASYDGSQGGTTDGIALEVLGEDGHGQVVRMMRRVIDPAVVAGDRGGQTARVEFTPGSLRMLTVKVDAGPRGNDAYDWSYLAAPRFEAR